MTDCICNSDRKAINTYRNLMGNFLGRKHFGRLKRRWEGNSKTDLRERGCKVVVTM
jgi:hypothetical protein